MKRNLLFVVLAITGLLCGISSCQKAPELTLTSSSNIEFSADGSSGSITFTANRDWTARANDSWVSVSPSSGAASDGAVTVTVRCNANITYEDRSTTVTISMGDLSQTVSVKQPANKGIVLPKQVFELQSDTRSIDVEVQANVQYSVSSSVDWIKQTGTKALTSKTLTFSIQENKTYDSREGKITIKPNEGNVQEQVITVRQAQKDALIVEKTSYDMPYGGGEIEIKVEANVAFNVTPNVDWLHYIQTKALSSSTVCIKVDENTTYSNREGKIEIAQQNGSLKHTITVKQAGRIAVTSVTLDKTNVILKEGESVTLVATVTPDNATDKTVIWSSSNADIATVDNGKVIAVKEGPASIIAKAGEKSATCSISVTSSSIPEGNIVFADSGIKSKLVAAFDSDNDGELSYREAAAVTSIVGVFGEEKGFTSFKEFQFFTSVVSIPDYYFFGWTSLSSIVLPDGLKSIGMCAFQGCYDLTSLQIPDGVSSIGEMAFTNCKSLGSITLPKNLTKIDRALFSDCSSLLSVSIPDGVQTIANEVFVGCSSLSSIIIPESVVSIGYSVFRRCVSLTSVTIPKNVVTIGEQAFDLCSSLVSITILGSITVIPSSFLNGCTKLESVTIPESVTSIEAYAFGSCAGLTSLVIPESVVSIGAKAFESCSKLKDINIPTGVSRIEEGLFQQCTSLTSISIPNGVQTIGYSAFYKCTELASISIPESVVSIGANAFGGCSNVSYAKAFPTNPPTIGTNTFEGTYSLYVPSSSVEKYKNADVWKELASRIHSLDVF